MIVQMLDITGLKNSFYSDFQWNCEVINHHYDGPCFAATGRIHISGVWLFEDVELAMS